MTTSRTDTVNTVKNLQRLQRRHWRYGNVEAFNRFREFLYKREMKISEAVTERAFAKIKRRPETEKKAKILHYCLPVDNE